MKVAIKINGQSFIGEAGTWDEAEEAAMKAYGAYMRAEMSLPRMQGDEDQAFLQAEADAATFQGLAHLDYLVADNIAVVERLEGPSD